MKKAHCSVRAQAGCFTDIAAAVVWSCVQPTFTMYKGARKVENFTGARVDLLRSVLQKHAS